MSHAQLIAGGGLLSLPAVVGECFRSLYTNQRERTPLMLIERTFYADTRAV